MVVNVEVSIRVLVLTCWSGDPAVRVVRLLHVPLLIPWNGIILQDIFAELLLSRQTLPRLIKEGSDGELPESPLRLS